MVRSHHAPPLNSIVTVTFVYTSDIKVLKWFSDMKLDLNIPEKIAAEILHDAFLEIYPGSTLHVYGTAYCIANTSGALYAYIGYDFDQTVYKRVVLSLLPEAAHNIYKSFIENCQKLIQHIGDDMIDVLNI